MKYYIVSCQLPTNSPGEWSRKRVFRSYKPAKAFLKGFLDEDSVELPQTEWDDGGPNWGILEAWDTGDSIVTLEEIEND